MLIPKHFAIAILSIAFLSAGIQAQSRLDLRNRPIEDELLVKILTYGEMKEIKPTFPDQSDFFLRLYSIEGEELIEEGYCAGAAEVEISCSNRYFLAVGVGSLGVPGTVYDLGEVGDISKIEWLKKSESNFVGLRLEISNYPQLAFKYNPKLVKKTKIVEIAVNLSSLKINEVK